MNPGTFQGAGTGATNAAITGYVQSAIIKTSQRITAPAGTKRIEALVCGGGGSGVGNAGGGGFGGLAVMGIPVTGMPYDVVVGAGGVTGAAGNPSQVWSAGMMYAEVGGGGGGAFNQYDGNSFDNLNGRSGGSGAGNRAQYFAGHGGTPPIGEILWYYAPARGNIVTMPWNTSYWASAFVTSDVGNGAYYNPNANSYSLGSRRGSNGGGGGGGCQGVGPSYGGGGGGGDSGPGGTAGNLGGGGGALNTGTVYNGGSLATVNIWGITGKANGLGQNGGAGGGGGLLTAGVTGTYTLGALLGYTSDWDPIYAVNYIGGDGGDGGGGGGAVYVPGSVYAYYDAQGQYYDNYVNPAGPSLRAGNGGNGFVIFRFFF